MKWIFGATDLVNTVYVSYGGGRACIVAHMGGPPCARTLLFPCRPEAASWDPMTKPSAYGNAFRVLSHGALNKRE